jgi:hypothetical protein
MEFFCSAVRRQGAIFMTSVFSPWPENAAADFGRRPLKLRHKLVDNSLFSDEALVRLIEATPRKNYHVNTMPSDSNDPHLWREGDMTGLSGREVLAAVARGALWVHLQRTQETDDAYRVLLDAAFEEIERNVPGFKSFKRSMSVLVSSPLMNVAYHADVPGQSLWQVRGRKRVWIYPARAPFLPRRALENIVLQRASDTDLPFDASFEAQAESYLMEPGDMATWPRNSPHRVVNEDCVNVSFTTEHWTRELAADYVADYANGLLRPWFGGRDLSRETRGPVFLAKAALASGHKFIRRFADRGPPLTVDFRVAPEAERGFTDVPPYALSK